MSEDFIEKIIPKIKITKKIEQNSYLFYQNDAVCSVYIVDAGLVELTRNLHDGTSIVLQRAGDRTILAEASVYSQIYHCDAFARYSSTVFVLPKATFLKFLRDDEELSLMWGKKLAQEIQSTRNRLEILSRHTVSDRLDGWLVLNDSEMPLKGEWKSIASQIGVSPESLYRELAKRRKNAKNLT